jgi:hypothetical protein
MGSRRDDRRLTTVCGQWRHTVPMPLSARVMSGDSTTSHSEDGNRNGMNESLAQGRESLGTEVIGPAHG